MWRFRAPFLSFLVYLCLSVFWWEKGFIVKVCPNCGFIDYSGWRQNRWRTNVEFLQWDQTEDIDTELLQKLKATPKEIQTDKYYAYRNAGRVVEKIILDEFKAGGAKAFHIPREKVNHKLPDVEKKSQRTLLP